MRGNVRRTQSMSQVGKKQSWVKEMQTKDKSQSIYDWDGMLSTQQQKEIKTSTTLPPLPSTEDKFLRRDWRDLALCKNKTVQFFRHRCSTKCVNHQSGCSRVRVVRQCKELCSQCPVLEHCRLWAINTNLIKGIAGGMTEIERRHARTIITGVEQNDDESDTW